MTKEEIYEGLCCHNPLNPLYTELDAEGDKYIPREKCYCDNCFYGRNKLALEILHLIEVLEEIYESNPGTHGFDTAELASARWEIAAKALGKL